MSHADHLTKLDLPNDGPNLELCCLQLDLIYCHKIVFGLVKLNSGDFLEFSLSNPTEHRSKG